MRLSQTVAASVIVAFLSIGSLPVAGQDGACCEPDGSCRVLPQFVCDVTHGMYQGDDASCVSSTCVAFGGACCSLSGCQQTRLSSHAATQLASRQAKLHPERKAKQLAGH